MNGENTRFGTFESKGEYLFAKIMDEHAWVEGYLLLKENRRIEKENSVRIPEGFDRRVLSAVWKAGESTCSSGIRLENVI